MVVFGHLLEVFRTSFYELFLLIYAFHMPLFIYISGYLAKRVRFEKVINLFLIYIIFQTIFSLAVNLVSRKLEVGIDFTVPFFHLWYLVSMIVWYLIAMLIIKTNPKLKYFILVIIILVSVISRFYTEDVVNLVNEVYPGFHSYAFSYQRTLSFAPYFFLGFFVNHELLKKVYSSLKSTKLIAFASASIILVYFYFANQENVEFLFRGSYGVETLTASNFNKYFEVGFTYLISIWLCYLFLNLVNNKESELTKWGDNTLTIFLFHPFFVLALMKFQALIQINAAVLFIVLLAASIGITLFLSSKRFIALTSFISNPYTTLKAIRIKIFKTKEVQ